jgi:hypothetical protein
MRHWSKKNACINGWEPTERQRWLVWQPTTHSTNTAILEWSLGVVNPRLQHAVEEGTAWESLLGQWQNTNTSLRHIKKEDKRTQRKEVESCVKTHKKISLLWEH